MLPALLSGLRITRDGMLSLVYPPSCIACGAATADPHGLCASCWSGLQLIERPFCERFGTPFAIDLGVGALLSPRAIAEPPVFTQARSVALYEGTARELVHRLKYRDRIELGRVMARMMASAGRDLLDEAQLVVPVPLHRFRLWRRRFNQAAILAEGVAAIAGRPIAMQALLRVKPTRPQVGLTRPQRAQNLQGAFRVPQAARPLLAGRNVLLVDDVTTSGATGNAASRVLLRAGAAKVDLLTFASVADSALG